MNIKLKINRYLINEPYTVKLDGDYDENCNAISVFGRLFPAHISNGVLTAILSLAPGEYDASLTNGDVGGTSVSEKENELEILINGEKFTGYVYTDKLAKPYLGPVMTSFGESYTRLDFETTEHPHHRSVFFGVGDVSVDGVEDKNVDFWNEPANCGIQKHVGIENISSNAAYTSFLAKTQWCSHNGTPMIDAECEYKIYNQPSSCRYIDLALTYTASYGDVSFGVTKEAGPLGVRMADPLRVDNGGYMANSYGAVGEGECWGRAANWCVFGGELSGKKVGIAVFDNEKNERYPTTWHIRNYGLFAANNLYFRGGLSIPEGEKLTYRYRLVFFEGAPDRAYIKDRFITYDLQK